MLLACAKGLNSCVGACERIVQVLIHMNSIRLHFVVEVVMRLLLRLLLLLLLVFGLAQSSD